MRHRGREIGEDLLRLGDLGALQRFKRAISSRRRSVKRRRNLPTSASAVFRQNCQEIVAG
jgi:hypothetical protein